jgi:hypothetical protein
MDLLEYESMLNEEGHLLPLRRVVRGRRLEVTAQTDGMAPAPRARPLLWCSETAGSLE